MTLCDSQKTHSFDLKMRQTAFAAGLPPPPEPAGEAHSDPTP